MSDRNSQQSEDDEQLGKPRQLTSNIFGEFPTAHRRHTANEIKLSDSAINRISITDNSIQSLRDVVTAKIHQKRSTKVQSRKSRQIKSSNGSIRGDINLHPEYQRVKDEQYRLMSEKNSEPLPTFTGIPKSPAMIKITIPPLIKFLNHADRMKF